MYKLNPIHFVSYFNWVELEQVGLSRSKIGLDHLLYSGLDEVRLVSNESKFGFISKFYKIHKKLTLFLGSALMVQKLVNLSSTSRNKLEFLWVD